MVIDILILAYYKQGLKTIMTTDFSDYINSGVLFLLGEDGLLHFVIFFSKNSYFTKCNHKIYHEELVTIISYFEQ